MLSHQLDNPVTGDRTTILTSPLTGQAGPLRFRTTLPPGAAGSPVHRHGRLTESFAVEAGTLAFWTEGHWERLNAGDSITVHPGEAHGFRNDSDADVTFVCTVAPGDGFERFLRIMTGLAVEGRTRADGMPRSLAAMALAIRHADLTLAALPGWAQQPLLAILARQASKQGLDRFWRQS